METSLSFFVAGNATYKSLCRSVRPSVRPSVGPSVGRSHFTFFALLSYLKVEKFRYEYFMDINAPAQIITAPAQHNTALAQHNNAPAQPPATGVVVYTALFSSGTYSERLRSYNFFGPNDFLGWEIEEISDIAIAVNRCHRC